MSGKEFTLEGIRMSEVATNDTEMVELSKKEIIVGLLTPGEYRFSDLVTYYGLSIFPVLYREEGRPGVPALGYFTGIGVTEDVGGAPYEGRVQIKDLVLFLTTTRIKADRELVPVLALIDKGVAVEANVSPLALDLGNEAFKGAQLDGDTLHQKYGNTGALLIYKEGGEVKTGFIIKSGDTIVPPEESTFILLSSCENGYQGIHYHNVVLGAGTLLPVFALMEKGISGVGAKSLSLGQAALDSLQSPDTIERLAELWLGNPQHTWECPAPASPQ